MAVTTALAALAGALTLLPAYETSAQTSILVTTTADELNNDGDCSLREAIETANRDTDVDACAAGSGADTVIVPEGIYTTTITGSGEDANCSGDYDIASNMQIVGHGTGSIIAGGAFDRLFHILPNAMLQITGLELRNGSAATGEPGGAILNQGVLAIEQCTISASRSGNGNNCAGVPAPCVSSAGGDGGGIYNSGVLTISATFILNNATGEGGTTQNSPTSPIGAKVEPDGRGGGLYNAGDLLMVECEVAFNRAYGGGGLYNGSRAVILAAAVHSNDTTAWGEGIFPPTIRGSSGGDGGGIANSGGVLDLRRSAVYDNATAGGGDAPSIGSHAVGGSGGRGGGLYNTGVMTITNSTIARNRTGAGGGGIWGGSGGDGGGVHNAGVLTVNNATIALNQTGAAGGGQWGSGQSGIGGGIANIAAARVKNTLFSLNRAGAIVSDCGGSPLFSLGYNLFSAAECAGAIAPTDRLMMEAQLGPPGNYGGKTWTLALLKFSPAVDTGSCTDSEMIPVTSDQRSVARPQINNCDIGAYEVEPVDAVDYLYLPVCRR